MSKTEILVGFALGLLATEVGDWCPWLARRMVVWYARLRYQDDPDRAAIRGEELAALIDARPGRLAKLLTGAVFGIRAIPLKAGRASRVLRTRDMAVPAFRLGMMIGKVLRFSATASLLTGVLALVQGQSRDEVVVAVYAGVIALITYGVAHVLITVTRDVAQIRMSREDPR